MRGKKRSPWLDPGSPCHRFSDSSFSWVGQDLLASEAHSVLVSFFQALSRPVPLFLHVSKSLPSYETSLNPTSYPRSLLWPPLAWWSPTHLHPCSIYSLHLRLAFSQELPLTCPVSPPNIYFGRELTASCSWAFGSGGDLWSTVSRSELNEAPDQEPTPGSPQEFPVKLPPPPLCVHFLPFQPHLWITDFPASPSILSLPSIQWASQGSR